MATPIKRIEKDFMLKVLYDEQIPMTLRYGRMECMALMQDPPKKELRLKTDKQITKFKKSQRFELLFDYRSQTISFTVEIKDVKDKTVIGESPEFLYKNLTRAFPRIQAPEDLKASFTYKGERYKLRYPRTNEYEAINSIENSEFFNPENIRDLVGQLDAWARDVSSGHKLIMFRDIKPTTLEERMLAEIGKVVYIPSTQTDLLETDPYPKKRIVTGQIFRDFLESSGTDPIYVDDQLHRFLKAKLDNGIYSDVWMPILFQEYVIGYIHLWIDAPGKPPFDLSVVDTLSQFARVLAYSLKINGYFKDFLVNKELYQCRVIDISASGLLFANGRSDLSTTLLPDSELELVLVTAKRTVKTEAKIVRRFLDGTQYHYGCRYITIAPEDRRFLFEYLYSKPMTDADAGFLTDTDK